MAIKLYQPLSKYQLSLHRTNTNGEKVRFQATLEQRMDDYEELLLRRTDEVAQLQKQWEAVVRDIWHLGVHCLGKGVMENLLCTNAITSSERTRAKEKSSTLFVLEQGSTPPSQDVRGSKKRVTFEAPASNGVADVKAKFQLPEFLRQPPRRQLDTTLSTPSVSDHDIKKLEKVVKELGSAQIMDYRKIVKDREAFWRKKTAHMVKAMEDE